MIEITCTNCKSVLMIDEAFAGGVCRCEHCGAIQTVPARPRPQSPLASAPTPQPAARPGSARTLYQHRVTANIRNRAGARAGQGSGMEDLAQMSGSGTLGGSGLSSSGMSDIHMSDMQLPYRPASSRQVLLATVIGGIVLVLLLGILLFGILGGRNGPRTNAAATGPAPPIAGSTPTTPVAPAEPAPAPPAVFVEPAEPAEPSGPFFAGIDLEGSTIIYLLDRDSATAPVLGALRDATVRSMYSLGPQRQFQVIFWGNGSEFAWPAAGPTDATPENIRACQRAMENVVGYGGTRIDAALQRALTHYPDVIVMATGNGRSLDRRFVQRVEELTWDFPVQIHTLAIGHSPSPALETVAGYHAGRHRRLTEPDLQAAAE